MVLLLIRISGVIVCPDESVKTSLICSLGSCPVRLRNIKKLTNRKNIFSCSWFSTLICFVTQMIEVFCWQMFIIDRYRGILSGLSR